VSERPARILNVNDREIPRYVNEEMLRRAGFDVVSVASGLEALGRAREFELVVLDVQLPDLDGFEVCRRLKRDPATAGVVVLLTSAAFVSSVNKVTGLESGADGYIVQPFEGAELIATVRALLRTRAAEREAQALAKELRAAMDVRDEFLAMLGHELRNPIGAISTALHLLREQPAALPRYLKILDRQTTNLGRIVDDLLDVARITRGKLSLQREPVELKELVERAVQALAGEAHDGIAIAVSGERVKVLGDPVRLEQIVANLLTNAIKYTPRGGRADVKIARDGDQAVISVTDTGIGMDAATCARVFDLFVQGKQSIDRSRGGLGLGLTVVRQLVELHGGKVVAHSAGEGKGSTFTVSLPRHEEATREMQVAEPAPDVAPLHVVAIEDNDDVRETMCDALAMLGYKVDSAADGKAGVELVLAKRPDVALVDIGLPELDGYGVARAVRAAGGRQPQMIAVTGYGQPEDHQRCLAAGFDMHVTKPVTLARLRSLFASRP
jgi:signal transduction histidine kinase